MKSLNMAIQRGLNVPWNQNLKIENFTHPYESKATLQSLYTFINIINYIIISISNNGII